jgi:hypothetical protein
VLKKLLAVFLGRLLFLSLRVVARQTILALGVREASFFTSHIVYPLLITLEARVAAQLLTLGSQVEPAKSVSDSADLVTDTVLSLTRHPGMELMICVKVHDMSSNGLIVARGDEKAIDLVLDLKGNTAFIGDNHRNSCVESLRDLDFETLTSGQLENNVGIGDDHVEKLVVGVQAHDADVVEEVRIMIFKLGHGLIKDNGTIRVINGPITAAVNVSSSSGIDTSLTYTTS